MGIMVYFLVSVTEKLDNLTQFWRWPLGDGYGEGGSFERERVQDTVLPGAQEIRGLKIF